MQVLIDNINYELDFDAHIASVCSLGYGEYCGDIVIPATLTYNNTAYSVMSIGCGAFDGCTGLISVEIPNSVKSIGKEAFVRSGLKSITIPLNIVSIGECAFGECNDIISIMVEKGNKVFDSRSDCNAIIETKTNMLIVGCKNTIIPNTVSGIGKYAFFYCESLTSIIIPNSVTKIRLSAFEGCSALTSISIPNSVNFVGVNAFKDTPWFDNQPDGVVYINKVLYKVKGDFLPGTNIVVKEGTTHILGYSFAHCTGISSISIPKSVIRIASNAFSGCDNITSITVDTENPVYDSRDNCNAIIETKTNTLIISCQSTIIPDSVENIEESIDLPHTQWWDNQPNGVIYFKTILCGLKGKMRRHKYINVREGTTVILDNAFMECHNLCSITFPKSLERIGTGAFCDCDALMSITIPNNVTSISAYTFESCSQLNSITIPNSVKSIYKSAFNNCLELKSIIIPSAVDYIGTDAFWGCEHLSLIIVEKGNHVYDSRNDCNALIETASNTMLRGTSNTIIPNSIKSIGDGAFSCCSGLKCIIIPESVTSIGRWAFFSCINLTSIVIPKYVERIEPHSFEDCRSLISISIPNSIMSIGLEAFRDCSNLTTITIPYSVNVIGMGVFENCNALSAIRIPKGKQSIFNADDLKELQDKIIEYTPALINGVQYELDSDLTAIVCARAKKYAGEVVVPMRVEQEGNIYIVNRLGDMAFADCYDLTTITLPKSITEIGKDVFLGCENLQTIRVPQGMTDQFCQMGLEPWRDKIVEPRQEEYTILLNIARGYELGIGMARNLAQAVLCYAQAADKGCAEAAYHLGELYAEGKGLPQDYQQAADWFGKAATLYHPNGAARQQECLRIIDEMRDNE